MASPWRSRSVANTEKVMDQLSLQTTADCIQQATMEVFSTMLGTELECGVPGTEPSLQNETVGVLSFAALTGTWVGTGCLSCSPAVACHIASQFLMDKYETVNEEVLDAFAEVTNMVIGGIKHLLEAHIGPLSMGVPTAIFGRNFISRTPGTREWVVVPFTWSGHQMIVHFTLSPKEDSGVRAGSPHTGCVAV